MSALGGCFHLFLSLFSFFLSFFFSFLFFFFFFHSFFLSSFFPLLLLLLLLLFCADKSGFVVHKDEGHTNDEGHKQLDRNMQNATDEEIHRQAREMDEKYGTKEDEDEYASEARASDFSSDHISLPALQPTADDPNLWLVRCKSAKKRGSNRHLALALMRKFFDKEQGEEENKLHITSVVTCDHIPGYLYIEAVKKTDVEKVFYFTSSSFPLSRKTSHLLPSLSSTGHRKHGRNLQKHH